MKTYPLLVCIIAFSFNPCFAKTINVKKFGARGNGKTDDTRAIQAAINSVKDNKANTIYFPKGTYLVNSYTITSRYLENYCLRLHSNITFRGEGKSSIIKLGSHILDKTDSNANAHIFYGSSIVNIKFISLVIDLNGKNNLVPEGYIKNAYAVFIKNGRNFRIKNLRVKNSAGRNMIILTGNGSNAVIEQSTFLNGGYNTGGAKPNEFQNDFSFIYSEWDSTVVINNRIEQQNLDIALKNYSGGIELHGSYCRAAGNRIKGCFPGLYISSSWHPMEKTVVENNQLISCIKGIIFWVNYPMNGITIQNNNIQLVESRRIKTGVQTGIEVPNGNVMTYTTKWANNAPLNNILIRNNTITSLVDTISDSKTAGIMLHSLQKSIVNGNIIKGMNYGGIVLKGSKWGTDSLIITKNVISAFKYNTDSNAVGGYIVITDTYSNNVKDAPGFNRIYINQNDFLSNPAFKKPQSSVIAKRKFKGIYIAAPGPMTEQIHIEKNNFSNKEEKIQVIKTD